VAEKDRFHDTGRAVGFLAETTRQARLILRLLRDRRVAIWPKLIVPATIVYLLSPIDLLPDPILGLGQIDDFAVILIGMKLFVELCPTRIVREHLDALSSVINGSYRVLEEESQQVEPSGAELSAPPSEQDTKKLPANGAE